MKDLIKTNKLVNKKALKSIKTFYYPYFYVKYTGDTFVETSPILLQRDLRLAYL